MPYNRMYNELLPPENESMSDLTRTLIGIQMRREEKARQAKLDALFEERQRQQMQMAQDEQALKIAEIQQRATAATPEAQLPTVPKTTSEGAFLNPAEAEFAGVEAPPSGFVKTGEMTSDVPDVSPLTVNLSEGRSVRIPQQSLEGSREIAQQDFMAKLPQMIAEALATGRTVSAPGVEPYDVVPASVGAAQERVPAIPGFRDVTVDGKRDLLTNEMIAKLKSEGRNVLDYDKPPAATGEKGQWLTRTEDGKRVWVSDEAKRTAPEGMFSDVRPTSTSVRKADPAKLKMAYSALGGPDVKDSLWNLAVTINTDPSMAGAVKGWARDVNAAHNPRAASRMDPTAVKYRSQIMGFASSIAKAFGESGVLTNQDIQRAVNLFPLIGDDPTVTTDKLNRVKAVMEAGITSDDFRSIFGRDPSPVEGGGVGGGAAPSTTGKSVGGFIIEKVQ